MFELDGGKPIHVDLLNTARIIRAANHDYEDFFRNISTWLVNIAGKQKILWALNEPKEEGKLLGIHAEAMVARKYEELRELYPGVKSHIEQVYTERNPCGTCQGILSHHLYVPKASVFFSVHRGKDAARQLMTAWGFHPSSVSKKSGGEARTRH